MTKAFLVSGDTVGDKRSPAQEAHCTEAALNVSEPKPRLSQLTATGQVADVRAMRTEHVPFGK